MNQVIRWSNNDILINNTVRIVDPYRAENVSIDTPTQSTNATNSKASAKGDNDTKTHIIKLVNFSRQRNRKASSFCYRWKSFGQINQNFLQTQILSPIHELNRQRKVE